MLLLGQPGEFQAEAVIDALGSQWLKVRDLTMLGENWFTDWPSIGTAANHLFESVKIVGLYSFAWMANVAAEMTEFNRIQLRNAYPHCADKEDSFNENDFIKESARRRAASRGGSEIPLVDPLPGAFVCCVRRFT